MAVVWARDSGGSRYEVRAHGRALRLYSNGVFHSAWNPRLGLTGRVWDLFLVAAFAGTRTPRRVLILGTGGGTFILQLRRFLGPLEITGVDLDPVHIEVAREYFGVDETVADLFQADAREWVAAWRGPPFDLVVDDLFGHVGGEPVRAVDMDARWARALGELVAPGGVLAANFIAPKDLRRSAPVSNPAVSNPYASAWQLRTASDANAVGVFCRDRVGPREWRGRVRAVAGLDDRVPACRLDYEIRRLRPA